MSRWLLGCLLVLVCWCAWLQAQPLPSSCESQLAQDYRILASEQLLPAAASPLPSWQVQLSALVTRVRVLTTQVSYKRQQVEQAEEHLATVQEQVRQLEWTKAQLTHALEQARKGEP